MIAESKGDSTAGPSEKIRGLEGGLECLRVGVQLKKSCLPRVFVGWAARRPRLHSEESVIIGSVAGHPSVHS